MAGFKLRQYNSTPERELDIPGLKLFEPVSDRFADAVRYRNYRLLNSSLRYDDDVALRQHKMGEER